MRNRLISNGPVVAPLAVRRGDEQMATAFHMLPATIYRLSPISTEYRARASPCSRGVEKCAEKVLVRSDWRLKWFGG